MFWSSRDEKVYGSETFYSENEQSQRCFWGYINQKDGNVNILSLVKIIETEQLIALDRQPEGNTLQQIKGRRYADKYQSYGQPIHLVSVECSRNSRT